MSSDFGMPDPNAPKPVLKVAACESCGGLPHGSSQLELNCFRDALRAAKAKLSVISDQAELEEFLRFKKLRAEVKALPLSHSEKLAQIKRVPIK